MELKSAVLKRILKRKLKKGRFLRFVLLEFAPDILPFTSKSYYIVRLNFHLCRYKKVLTFELKRKNNNNNNYRMS